MKKLVLLLFFFLILLWQPSFSSVIKTFRAEKTLSIWGIKFTHYFSLRPNRPLLLLLHGCMQNADDFRIQTDILKYASANDLNIILAEQNFLYHYQRCWNWFLPQNQTRTPFFESGIMVQHLIDSIQKYQADSKRVYVVGLSAGGAMANNLAVCWPDIIKGAVIHSGISFAPTTSLWNIGRVLKSGPDKSYKDLAWNAFNCFDGLSRPEQKIFIVHGLNDKIVNPENSKALIQQWRGVWDYTDDGFFNQSISFESHEKYIEDLLFSYTDSTLKWRNNELRSIFVESLGHAWSGGNAAVRFSSPNSVLITGLIQKFFNLNIEMVNE